MFTQTRWPGATAASYGRHSWAISKLHAFKESGREGRNSPWPRQIGGRRRLAKERSGRLWGGESILTEFEMAVGRHSHLLAQAPAVGLRKKSVAVGQGARL